MVPGLEEVHGTVRTYTTAGAPERFVRQENVNMQGINTECNGRVWRVDVGMSRAFLETPFQNLEAQRERERRCLGRSRIFCLTSREDAERGFHVTPLRS
jgi:hypothetical protein